MAACHHDYKNTRKDFTSTTKQGVQQVTFSSFLIVCLIIVVRLYVEDKSFSQSFKIMKLSPVLKTIKI